MNGVSLLPGSQRFRPLLHPAANSHPATERSATHYLFTVKANELTLLARCPRLAWHPVPVLDQTRARSRPHHPPDHARMNRTLRENAGALGPRQARR
jgi:hypothetical protein